MSTKSDQHALCSELLWLRDERIRELEGQLRTLRAERGTVDGWDPVGGRPINPDVTRGPWNDAEPAETRIDALRAASNQAVTDGDDRRAAYVRGQVDLLSEQRSETETVGNDARWQGLWEEARAVVRCWERRDTLTSFDFETALRALRREVQSLAEKEPGE